MDGLEHHSGTFGKEAVPDGDPVGGVGSSGGTARLSPVVPLQLAGQCEHGCAAVILLALPPRCTAPHGTAALTPVSHTG